MVWLSVLILGGAVLYALIELKDWLDNEQ